MTPLVPQLKIGDYHLIRLLGKGGMGEVWLATDIRADRSVAVKFIKPGYLDDPAVRTRFLNEAKTLGRLEQDRIVTLYNVVEDGTNLALVLRFIDGTSLADRIDSEGVLPLDFVLSSARDILPALGFAHEHGVIHRDMKPQNVLLDRHSRSFLTDFGIAVGDFAQRGTVTGFAVGTPHYMSPEQIQTPRQITVQDGGHRSDIYSYGVVLYEMLTGRVPFCSESGVEEIYKIQHAHCVVPPTPLREINPRVPEAVQEVVLRALAKNPDDRPQTCAQLLKELETAVANGNSAVRTRPPAAQRPATIVERAPSVGSTPVASSARVDARPPAPIRSRGLPKAAWLSLGGLMIIGGISYAIAVNASAHKRDNTRTSETHPSLSSSTSSIVTDTKKPPFSGPRRETASLNRGSSPPNLPSGTYTGTAPGSAPNELAVRDYGQALDFQRRQMSCEALAPATEAARLDPTNQKYLVLQQQVKQACDVVQSADADYKNAKQLFDQGDYCEGKGAIDEAVKKVPTNRTYLELQQSLRKGCTIP